MLFQYLRFAKPVSNPYYRFLIFLGRDRFDGWLGDSSGRPTVSRRTARAAMISGFRGARTILQQQRANITEFTVIIMCKSIT
jgi:hypothetical protein